jgi:hypothetical protein
MTPLGRAEHIAIVCSCAVDDRSLNTACAKCIAKAIAEAKRETLERAIEQLNRVAYDTPNQFQVWLKREMEAT